MPDGSLFRTEACSGGKLVPGTEQPPADWMLDRFDDSSRDVGSSGFGYGDGDFDLTSLADLLRPGDNVLAVQGHNLILSRIDFSLDPTLFLSAPEKVGPAPRRGLNPRFVKRPQLSRWGRLTSELVDRY